MTNIVSRRDVVAGAAVTAALASMPRVVRSATLPVRPGPLLLLDGSLAGTDLARARSLFAEIEPRILQADLVWEWRRDLGEILSRGMRAVVVTRWDKALLLSGLARESGLVCRQSRLGPGAFRTDIG